MGDIKYVMHWNGLNSPADYNLGMNVPEDSIGEVIDHVKAD
jgi:hypothetical protein